jgi:hypothetical protein
MTKPERPRDKSLWTRIMHQVIASCTATRAQRFPLAEPLLHGRNLRRFSGPVHQYVLHVAQHMSSAIVMEGTYLVLLMHAARDQDVRPLGCALLQVCAIRAVYCRAAPRALLAVDEGEMVECHGEAVVLVAGHDVQLGML